MIVFFTAGRLGSYQLPFFIDIQTLRLFMSAVVRIMTKLVRIISAGLIITTTVVRILTTVVIILTLRLIKSHKKFCSCQK